MASSTRCYLGIPLLAQGQVELAQRTLEEALAWARSAKNSALTQTALHDLAQSELARRRPEIAARMLEEGIGLHVQVGDEVLLAQFLEALAAVASSEDEAERTALLLGASEGLLQDAEAPGYNLHNPDPSLWERLVTETRPRMGGATFEEAWARGREMSLEQAVEYALRADTAGGNPVA